DSGTSGGSGEPGNPGEPGEPGAVGLDRAVQTLVPAQQVVEGTTLHTTLITDQVRFLSFRYFDGTTWRSKWTGGGLPSGIEVTLGALPLPDGMDPAEYP